MLASDVNNPQFSGAQDPDSVMIAKFYTRAIENTFKSKKEGRPIFEDIIYCQYYPAGSTLLQMDVPAQESHRQRFAKQWAYFQSTQGGDSREIGTPLSQWAILSPADVENLKGMKFQTIENIAAASDLTLQKLGMGVASMAPHILRARAQAYLGSSKDLALPQRQAEELERMKSEQSERDERHAAEIAELRAMIQAQVKPAKPGKRILTEEQKQAARDRMKHARESKHKAA